MIIKTNNDTKANLKCKKKCIRKSECKYNQKLLSICKGLIRCCYRKFNIIPIQKKITDSTSEANNEK